MEPERISPRETLETVRAGKAILVCAYEEDSKCREMHLDGAIFLSELKSRLVSLPKEQEIVFYCG